MIAFVLMLLSLNDLYAENRIGADFALNIPEEIFENKSKIQNIEEHKQYIYQIKSVFLYCFYKLIKRDDC